MADKYEYIRIIGKGSFGKAWLVESKTSQRQYVLKEIKVSDMGEKDRHQAVNEVAILARLKHKNVVRYREAFVSAGTLSIVMGYADGGDLSHQIQKAKEVDKFLPETRIMRWFVQITFALVYIHNLKILHRDLKPQNIFLTSKDVIKIGDFGIARTLKNSQDRANTAIGTPYYLSPEICRRQPYYHKSDMWAAGCVLYELLTRNHPFEAEDFSVLILKILRGKYNDIPSVYGPLPGDLVSVLLRVNPERRPSADQIISIPSIRHYVHEYIGSSSSKGFSCALSDAPSETPQTSQVSQAEAVKSLDSKSSGRQTEQGKETPMTITEDNVTKPSITSSCSSASSLGLVKNSCRQPDIVGPNAPPDFVKKFTTPAKRPDDKDKQSSPRKREGMDQHYTEFRNKAYRRGKCVDRKTKNLEVDGCDIDSAYVSEKSGAVKRKSTDIQSKQEATYRRVAQRKLSEPLEKEEKENVFSKEGFTTVKRRKYSCRTPVAPKIVEEIGTPRSEKLRNAHRPARTQSASTPPVMRLFGKRPRDYKIAVNDGWSPDLSPRFQTRVFHKGFAVEATDIAKNHVIKENPKVGNDIRRNSLTDEFDGGLKQCESYRSNRTDEQLAQQNKQPKQIICCKPSIISDLGRKACDDNDTGIVKASGISCAMAPSSPLDRNNEIQREVCEILLACSSSASESSADIHAKIELLKTLLERRLGNQNAVAAYDLIVRMTGEGNGADKIMQKLEYILPQNCTVYIPLLVHVKSLVDRS